MGRGGKREEVKKESYKNDFSFLFSAEHQSLDRECQLQRTGQEATRLRLIQLPGGTSLQYFRGKGGGQVCTDLYCSSPHGAVSNTLSLRRVQLLLPNKILMMKGNVYKKCIAMFDSILSHPFFDFEKKIFPFREKYQYSQLVQLCFCRKKTSFKKRLRTRQMGGGDTGNPLYQPFPLKNGLCMTKIGRKNVLMPRQNMGCDKKWGQKLSDGFFIDGSFHH